MILEPQNGRANEPRCGSSSAPSSFMLFFRETHWEVSSSESIFGDIRHTWFVRKHIRLALAKAQAPLASKRWYTVMYAAATAWGSTNQAALKPARKARYWLPTMRRYKGSADGLFPVDAVSQSPSLFSTLSILRPLYNSSIHDKCMHEWLHKVSNPMRKRGSKYSTCSLFMSLPPVCLKGPRFALSIFSPWPWSRIKPWNPTAPRRCRMPIHAKVCQSWLASVEDFGLGMTTLVLRPSLGVSKDTFASLCLFGHKNKSSMRHWQSILGILEYLYIYIYLSWLLRTFGPFSLGLSPGKCSSVNVGHAPGNAELGTNPQSGDPVTCKDFLAHGNQSRMNSDWSWLIMIHDWYGWFSYST